MAEPDLGFVARPIERVLTDIGSLRGDMAVLTAIVTRLDGSQGAMLQELRAHNAQIARLADRIRKLKDAR